MRVDIINLGWRKSGSIQRLSHGTGCLLASRQGHRHMIRVVGRTVSAKLGVDACTALPSVLLLLQHERACSLPHHKTVAVAIEWTARPCRIVVSPAHRTNDRERTKRQRSQGSLHSTANGNIRNPFTYQTPCFPESDCTG